MALVWKETSDASWKFQAEVEEWETGQELRSLPCMWSAQIQSTALHGPCSTTRTDPWAHSQLLPNSTFLTQKKAEVETAKDNVPEYEISSSLLSESNYEFGLELRIISRIFCRRCYDHLILDMKKLRLGDKKLRTGSRGLCKCPKQLPGVSWSSIPHHYQKDSLEQFYPPQMPKLGKFIAQFKQQLMTPAWLPGSTCSQIGKSHSRDSHSRISYIHIFIYIYVHT